MIRLPFFRPISLRFCPSSPVRLRLSSQSRPASNPFCALPFAAAAGWSGGVDGAALAVGGVTRTWRGNVAGSPAARFEATPVANGFAVSPAETVT
jgi:hypothetical protein